MEEVFFVGTSDQLSKLIQAASGVGLRVSRSAHGRLALSADAPTTILSSAESEGDKPTLDRVNQLREARSLPPLAAL